MSDPAKKSQSVLFRTTLSLAVGTILVFFVLIVVFYRNSTRSLIEERKEKLAVQAESIALTYSTMADDPSVTNTAAQAFVNTIARTEDCAVWFCYGSGQIFYSTSVPGFIREDLYNASDKVYLSASMMDMLMRNMGVSVTIDSGNGIFMASRSVSVMVMQKTSVPNMYILLLSTLNVEEEVSWRLSNGLALPIWPVP